MILEAEAVGVGAVKETARAEADDWSFFNGTMVRSERWRRRRGETVGFMAPGGVDRIGWLARQAQQHRSVFDSGCPCFKAVCLSSARESFRF